MGQFYVKSFEDDFALKRLEGGQKVTFQTVEQVVKSRELRPNTASFGREPRLCTTVLCPNYTLTYRPQGIIFQTEERPDYILPFDMSLVSQAEEMVVEYYKIKDNIQFYYDHPLIPGCEQFFYHDLDEMLAHIPSPEVAWKLVNDFRVNHGFPSLRDEEYRLVQYNEAVFTKPVPIDPTALFGESDLGRYNAACLGLPYYPSAVDFYYQHGGGEAELHQR